MRQITPILALCSAVAPLTLAATATAQQPPVAPANSIELPELTVTRIQTTVFVPCNQQPILVGTTTLVDRAPREGWTWVGIGPRRMVQVFLREEEVPEEPALVNGVDPFLLPEWQKVKEEEERARNAPERILSAIELARRAMLSGDTAAAIEKFNQHLEAAPRDAAAIRELALAHFIDGKTDLAAQTMGRAYQQDPTLAASPLSVEIKGGKTARSRVAESAAGHAIRKKSAVTWLTALVLSQAEGNPSANRSIFQKAVAAGLDEHIAAQFRIALAAAEDKPAANHAK